MMHACSCQTARLQANQGEQVASAGTQRQTRNACMERCGRQERRAGRPAGSGLTLAIGASEALPTGS
jgi:hypothetical protein